MIDKEKLKYHNNRHYIILNGIKTDDQKYNDLCHELTSSPAKAINGSYNDVQGYIRQDGRRVKFKKLNYFNLKLVDSRLFLCYNIIKKKIRSVLNLYENKF